MRLVNNPKRIILHCSDTPDEGDRYGLAEIKKWHINERHFLDIGYHYIIRRSGVVEIGRPETEVGAHTKGENTNSIGICYIGTKRMSTMQINSLIMLISKINERHKIPADEIYGHYEFNSSKICPGQDMNVIRMLLKLAKV